jgi:3-deoxy-manno-octulosonate cytidylyltransferase (CMP-KDO synthetase)
MVVRVAERAHLSGAGEIWVATDHPEVRAACEAHEFAALMTRSDHPTGTDRLAEVVEQRGWSNDTIVVNVQGDEPEIDPAHIRLVANLLEQNGDAAMATLATPGGLAEQLNPNAVTVVLDHRNLALLFTRAPCPWDRGLGGPATQCLRHLGIYAYRREVLLGYKRLPPSRLETLESLEQLRALEAGLGIACAVVQHPAAGIDVRADYDGFLSRFRLNAQKGATP